MTIFKIGITVIYNGEKDENEISDKLFEAMKSIDDGNNLAFLNVDSIKKCRRVNKNIAALISVASKMKDNNEK